ncbi:hypothetical protein OSTOST_23572 [Ostertagia ostertagi]
MLQESLSRPSSVFDNVMEDEAEKQEPFVHPQLVRWTNTVVHSVGCRGRREFVETLTELVRVFDKVRQEAARKGNSINGILEKCQSINTLENQVSVLQGKLLACDCSYQNLARVSGDDVIHHDKLRGDRPTSEASVFQNGGREHVKEPEPRSAVARSNCSHRGVPTKGKGTLSSYPDSEVSESGSTESLSQRYGAVGTPPGGGDP